MWTTVGAPLLQSRCSEPKDKTAKKKKKRSPTQPRASAAKAADHLLLSDFEHMETSAAKAATPAASDLCGQTKHLRFSPEHSLSDSSILINANTPWLIDT